MMNKLSEYSLLFGIVGLIAIASAFIWADQKAEQNAKARAEKEAAKAAACLVSAECQDREARRKSRRDDEPIQSTTGQWFFKGDPCSEDCSGHVAGYQWAERIGATKEAACEDTNSNSFQKGCLSFVESYKPEIDEGAVFPGEEYEACGRFAC